MSLLRPFTIFKALNLSKMPLCNCPHIVDSFLIQSTPLYFQSRTFKKKKSKANAEQENEDSDDSDGETNGNLTGKGTDTKTSIVGSMRADLLLKVGLGVARNRVEEGFYESKIRLNSRKIFKKSAQVRVGDELDLIKGVSASNPLFLTVGRIEILSAKPRAELEGIEVKMRRSKALTIENYPGGDPWKQADTPPAS